MHFTPYLTLYLSTYFTYASQCALDFRYAASISLPIPLHSFVPEHESMSRTLDRLLARLTARGRWVGGKTLTCLNWVFALCCYIRIYIFICLYIYPYLYINIFIYLYLYIYIFIYLYSYLYIV